LLRSLYYYSPPSVPASSVPCYTFRECLFDTVLKSSLWFCYFFRVVVARLHLGCSGPNPTPPSVVLQIVLGKSEPPKLNHFACYYGSPHCSITLYSAQVGANMTLHGIAHSSGPVEQVFTSIGELLLLPDGESLMVWFLPQYIPVGTYDLYASSTDAIDGAKKFGQFMSMPTPSPMPPTSTTPGPSPPTPTHSVTMPSKESLLLSALVAGAVGFGIAIVTSMIALCFYRFCFLRIRSSSEAYRPSTASPYPGLISHQEACEMSPALITLPSISASPVGPTVTAAIISYLVSAAARFTLRQHYSTPASATALPVATPRRLWTASAIMTKPRCRHPITSSTPFVPTSTPSVHLDRVEVAVARIAVVEGLPILSFVTCTDGLTVLPLGRSVLIIRYSQSAI
ncbi:hypothetical protein FOZ62_013178, partial [Perkinsus olseni]